MNPGTTGRAVVALVRQARALVFDFDGTLVDSNTIKWRAFELCFAEYRERREEILAYCRGHHHVSREEKFRHVYEEILRLPYPSAVAALLHERFAEATTRQIIQAPEIPAAGRFLRGAAGRHETALLSTTPHDTLVHILEERGWRGYFHTVQGAPVAKAAWLRTFREGRGLKEPDVVFFGDTLEDAGAALAAGCTFVAVGNDRPAEAIHAIEDFRQLLTS